MHTRNGDHDLVLVLAGHGLPAPTEIVVTAKLKGVGRKIVGLDDQVLNDGIHHGIGVFDSWDWDVTHAFENTRYNNGAQILDKMTLERRLAVLVVSKIIEELLRCSSETLVLRILIKLLPEVFEFIKDMVGVVLVAFSKKEPSFVLERVPFVGGGILHDKAGFLETLTNVAVNRLEPAF